MSDGHPPGNGVSLDAVMARIDKMADWAQGINHQLNGVDVATLWREADALSTQYSAVPAEIRELEQNRVQKETQLGTLKERYEIIDAQAMLDCIESNKEKREAEKLLALAGNEEAQRVAGQIRDIELEISLLRLEVQEKEKIWSDYHRKVTILASKAGVSYR